MDSSKGAGKQDKSAAGRTRKVRWKQADRRKYRREQLLQATVDLLVERGYINLTVADIAARAGVSSGARVHYFRTKDDLVVAANELVYNAVLTLGIRRAQRAKDPLDAMIRDQSDVYFGTPFLAALEAVVAARADSGLAARMQPIMEHYRSTINRVWVEAFVAAGYARRDADLIVRLTAHIMRGIGLSSVWKRDDAGNRQLLRGFRSMVAGLVKAEVFAMQPAGRAAPPAARIAAPAQSGQAPPDR